MRLKNGNLYSWHSLLFWCLSMYCLFLRLLSPLFFDSSRHSSSTPLLFFFCSSTSLKNTPNSSVVSYTYLWWTSEVIHGTKPYLLTNVLPLLSINHLSSGKPSSSIQRTHIGYKHRRLLIINIEKTTHKRFNFLFISSISFALNLKFVLYVYLYFLIH